MISSDEIVHRLLREAEVKDALVERFGPGILDEAGEIARPRVAEIVFADRDCARTGSSRCCTRASPRST